MSIINLLLAISWIVPAATDSPAAKAIYRATLQVPGGDLPFLLELHRIDSQPKAYILNGSERIEVPKVSWDGSRLFLGLEHYDSQIEAVADGAGRGQTDQWPEKLRGKWRKRAGKEKWAELEFRADPFNGFRFAPQKKAAAPETKFPAVVGRWAVRFAGSEDPAVGVFKELSDGQIEGTFLTPTGDYRYLAGTYEHGRLRLSCFDGAHAFLFDAQMQSDGTLKGDFWSRDASHETWTGKRDDNASLPDGFAMTHWTGGVPLDSLKFPDLDGTVRSLDDPAFRGKARIIEIFGTWCPNCHDASRMLADLDRTYRGRGLRIVGLAFELTGDFTRDAAQVRKFAKVNGIEYPVLIAGTNDKSVASAALPIIDRLRGYPTTILLGPDGEVRAVHTGFSGPATGEECTKLRHEFEGMIEELLKSRTAEKPANP